MSQEQKEVYVEALIRNGLPLSKVVEITKEITSDPYGEMLEKDQFEEFYESGIPGAADDSDFHYEQSIAND